EIKLSSTPGQGSSFTLLVPHVYTPVRIPRRRETAPSLPASVVQSVPAIASLEETIVPHAEAPAPLPAAHVLDDSTSLRPGDRVLLIIENDVSFAKFLLEVAHEHGFKGVLAHRGGAGLVLARELEPAAITLDINLPDIDGWRVLDRLKQDLSTRHV